MYRRLFIIAVLLLTEVAAWGQSPPTPDQADQIRTLVQQVQQLQQRVTELEAKVSAYPTPVLYAGTAPVGSKPVPQETPAATVQAHQHEGAEAQAAVRQIETHYPSLQVRGFGDVDFSATDQKRTTSGFNLGQLDLHLASALSQKVSYFGEITFNAQPTGYTVEVERNIIRYDYNDFFKISFGRYHTPIGYWNTAFHHGAWLQTTIARPEMVKFGGTFIPIHFVGFLAEGNIPAGGLGLGYSVGVGNGRGENISRPGDAGDNNNNRAWVANLFVRPAKLYGLQIGASGYRDKITLADGRNFREWIGSAYLVWTKEHPEFLAEFANVNHELIMTGQSSNNQAFYAQLGYRLPWFERTVKPYYRFEYTHVPPSERLFTDTMDLVGSIAGVRYDITNYASFKAEYRNSRRTPGDPRVNGAFFQTCFTF
jgi:hypothetical protein